MNPSQPILWVDPGKATGIALWTGYSGFFNTEQDFMHAGDLIEGMCQAYGSHLRAGWEHFSVTRSTPGDDAHHAIEMIGVMRRAVLKNRCQLLKTAMPNERNIATPAMLQHIGWWRAGEDDAQSAAQHLLAYMLRTDQVPYREAVALAELREKML